MRCQRSRDYFEHDESLVKNIERERSELAGHIRQCPECDRFAGDRQELETSLQLLRDSAPEIPDSLDRNVMVNYREHISDRLSMTAVQASERIRVFSFVRWAAALVFATVVAYVGIIMFLSDGPVPTSLAGQQELRPPTLSQSLMEGAAAGIVKKPLSRAGKLGPRSSKNRGAPLSVASDYRLSPPGFRSLMYCDELSCADGMEVIRVQLPPPVLGLPIPMSANGLVPADVLVGPDGIARGIRVVE
jgi:hypothetical protein